jgi:hypothetical protein
VRAVDADNDDGIRCSDARTIGVLTDAPPWAQAHADLALLDFVRAGSAPLAELSSDAVASGFSIRADGSLNTLVGRLAVPGGPWSGHYGLEAAIFSAQPARMPDWFPPLDPSAETLHFGDAVALSAGFRQGPGTVLFPELLARSRPLTVQSFRVVFLDRLVDLYATFVLPVARELGLHDVRTDEVRRIRALAFLAHEWGHRTVDRDYPVNAVRHARKNLAVLAEVSADLRAISMLSENSHPLAPETALTLVLDRVLREAWLPGATRQVGGIAGLVLLQLLVRCGALLLLGEAVVIDLPVARAAVEKNLDLLGMAYDRASRGDVRAADAALSALGLYDQAGHFYLREPAPVVRALRRMMQTR